MPVNAYIDRIVNYIGDAAASIFASPLGFAANIVQMAGNSGIIQSIVYIKTKY